MSIPIEHLRSALNVDEPDYPGLTRLGAKIAPQLLQLAQTRDAYIAANAVSLAGMIPGSAMLPVIQAGARSTIPQVRSAAAAALHQSKTPGAAQVLAPLLNDQDKSVRKFAIAAAGRRPTAVVAETLGEISVGDPEPALRAMAAAALRRYRS